MNDINIYFRILSWYFSSVWDINSIPEKFMKCIFNIGGFGTKFWANVKTWHLLSAICSVGELFQEFSVISCGNGFLVMRGVTYVGERELTIMLCLYQCDHWLLLLHQLNSSHGCLFQDIQVQTRRRETTNFFALVMDMYIKFSWKFCHNFFGNQEYVGAKIHRKLLVKVWIILYSVHST